MHAEEHSFPRRRRFQKKNLFFWSGMAIVGSYLGLAVFGEFLAPAGVDDQDLFAMLAPPSGEHLLGTDYLGRDLLSRVILGARYTVLAALGSASIAAVIGVALGAAAGYFGGRIDTVISALVEILLTIPLLILAIAIATVTGAGMLGLIMATSLSFTPPMARLVRSRVLEIRDEEFVQAARALGMAESRILVRHVLPSATTVITIEVTLLAGQAVLIGTALGFLGLGAQPPTPEWGTMLSRGREYMEIAPHLVVVPGIAITVLVLGLNILGDGLRDLLDPRTRELIRMD